MLEKMITRFVEPITEILSEHVVSIDGVEYLPMDNVVDVFVDGLQMVLEVVNVLDIRITLHVFCFLVLASGFVLLGNSILRCKKEANK